MKIKMNKNGHLKAINQLKLKRVEVFKLQPFLILVGNQSL
jgi:hypothetical protein